jgi:hypothetical protein
MRNLLVVVLVGLVVYTLIDVARSEPDERFGLSKALWILLILFFPVIGSIAWLVARQRARSGGAGGAGGNGGGSGGTRPGPTRPGPRRPPGPLAPDDDPEFLWRLEQMQRRAKQQRQDTGGDGASGAGPTDTPSSSEDDSPGHGTPGPRTSH